MRAKQVSIVVPVLNEEGNILALLERVQEIFVKASYEGEVIFVDDHSTDNTQKVIKEAAPMYEDSFKVRFFSKKGHSGKAQSLIEGFSYAVYESIVMIDGDLQYPPEAIPEMVEKLFTGSDIVVANRVTHDTQFIRSLLSKSFSFVFAQLLHDLDCDSQSGLKVFRKKILHEVILDPTPWTFDMEFLLSARNYGYVISTVDINFSERLAGSSKLSPLKAIFEIGWSALKLKYQGRPPLLIHPESKDSMHGAGIAHNRTRFVTHTTLHHDISALETFIPWQKVFLLSLVGLFILGLIITPLHTGIAFFAFITTLYFIDVFFNLGLVLQSLKTPPELCSTEEELAALNEKDLPLYSILCPLYKEAHMLPHFMDAIEKLDWPKDKLDVLLLLEENDQETVIAAEEMGLPSYVRIVVVPHSMPKTKPKACNYGLSVSRGEYTVIYDAEDIPDPFQLKKAFLAFQKSGPEVQCLQAKLNYFNPHQNMLTRLFTAEYSLWFDVILTGLQTINTSIPLGGTSNHFRTKKLLELQGWDPFNVTEDCDLGVRLFKRGYRTAVIDSVTLEEANSDWKNWLRQRSRWIKGYMQTYLVHMRNPFLFARENGLHALVFQLVVGGKIAFMVINPLLWITTISYFVFYAFIGDAIHALFPQVIFYMAVVSLVFGNFLYLYYYMIGCVRRGHFWLIKYVFVVPLYWLMVSIAAAIAAYQLFVKPHYWEKTNHGLHIIKEKTQDKEKHWSSRQRWVHAKQALISYAPNFIPKQHLHFIFSNKGFLVGAMVVGNFLNFIFNAFLGRVLSFSELNLVIFVNTLWFITTIFVNSFASTTNHRVSYLLAQKGREAMWTFFRRSLRYALYTVSLVSFIWIVTAPFLMSFFKVQDMAVLLFFTPVIIFGFLSYAFQGFLKGSLRFFWAAVVMLAEAVTKLLLAILFVYSSHPEWVYLSIPLSLMTAACVGSVVVWLMYKKISPEVSQDKIYTEEVVSFPFAFLFSSMAVSLSTILFLSVDVLLVKHFFNETQSGQYALLSLAGKMIYFLGALPMVFMVTLVSWKEGLKKNSERVLSTIFSSVLILVTLGVLILGVFGFVTAPILFGEKAREIVDWLPLYTLSIALFTLSSVLVTYHLAKREYSFSLVSLALSLVVITSIWFDHDEFRDIIDIIFGTSSAGLIIFSGMHFFGIRVGFLGRGLRDFLGVFTNGLPKAQPLVTTGRRILIFNWRDTTHRFAGGAEVYVHEIAKTWVVEGHHVTVFSGNDGTQERFETIDGVNIVRRGGFYLVYLWAFLYYMLRFRGRYDVVIDCENGIPFFTPLYVRKPLFCLMHHVHQEVFYHSLPKPLAWLASTLEKGLMPLVYRNVQFITVSESSKQEMLDINLGQAGISIVHPGINSAQFTRAFVCKTTQPTILYLGRLKAYKSVNILIQAFHKVLSSRPEATLIIAGDGDDKKYLKRLAAELGFNDKQVQFLGSVSHEEKVRLLQSSWMLVNPSFMEGWGIVVIEANMCGTPVIASDVPGLRDSVLDGEAGYLVPYGDVARFSEAMLSVIKDHDLRERFGNNAREWASNFTWEKSSMAFWEAIKSEY